MKLNKKKKQVGDEAEIYIAKALSKYSLVVRFLGPNGWGKSEYKFVKKDEI